MITEALYLLAEHLHTACHSIAFPELSATTVVALRSVVKSTKIVSLQKRCKRLLVQLEAQARFVSSRRDVVDFAPNDGDATAAFLSDEAAAGSSPYAKWFAVERADAQRAEREPMGMSAPFIVYKPAWLVSAEGEVPSDLTPLPWNERKLVFFAG